MKVIVIIPAAGLGTRYGARAQRDGCEVEKTSSIQADTELAGTPILIHTLRKFAGVDEVNEIWIALRENEIVPFRERLNKEAKDVLKKKIELVAGGEHRQQSVEQALNKVSAAPDDIVLCTRCRSAPGHGGDHREVIEAAKKYGAAIAGLPAIDTMKQVERTSDGAIIKTTIPRAGSCLRQLRGLPFRRHQESFRRRCCRRISWVRMKPRSPALRP